MDITETLAPKSDQQNYDDYAGGLVRTVTVERVTKGSTEQPIEIHLVEFPGRPFKPAKTVRRLIAKAWGTDSSVWVGRRMTLFGDPTVKWAGQAVGGIRISHMSHLDEPFSLMLAETQKKRTKHTIQPLVETAPPAPAPEPTEADVAACDDVDVLRGWWQQSGDERRAQIQARVVELNAATDKPDDGGAPWPAQDALPTEGGEK